MKEMLHKMKEIEICFICFITEIRKELVVRDSFRYLCITFYFSCSHTISKPWNRIH